MNRYNDKLEEPAANTTATEKTAFKDWMNRHGVARLIILLSMEPRMHVEYIVVDDAKTHWKKLASAYKSKLTLNIFEIREDASRIKLQNSGDVDNCALHINQKVKDYSLCAGPTAPLTTDTDAADTDSAKTIAKRSEQENIFCLLCGIPRNHKWKLFQKLMMHKNGTMTAMPDEIVTMLIKNEVAIKRENGLTPEALLCAKKGGKCGNGGKAGKGHRSPKRDKRDNKGDNNRKQKDLRKGFHFQRQGHITENCLSKQHGKPPKSANSAAKE